MMFDLQMLEADLDDIMSDFGVAVTTSSGSRFMAMFDVTQAEFQNPGEPPVIVNAQTLLCQESDLKDTFRDDIISVEGHGSFYIDSIQPDGAGTARILLRRYEYGS